MELCLEENISELSDNGMDSCIYEEFSFRLEQEFQMDPALKSDQENTDKFKDVLIGHPDIIGQPGIIDISNEGTSTQAKFVEINFDMPIFEIIEPWTSLGNIHSDWSLPVIIPDEIIEIIDNDELTDKSGIDQRESDKVNIPEKYILEAATSHLMNKVYMWYDDVNVNIKSWNEFLTEFETKCIF